MDPITIATAVLALINAAQPLLGNAGVIKTIIDGLEAIIPIVTTVAKNLIPTVRDAIAALKGGNVPISEDDLARLEQFSAQLDAAFDQSDAAATLEEQAAAKPAGTG